MRNLKPTSISWCLPAVLLLSLGLFTPGDAEAQRRKRVDERRNPSQATAEEQSPKVEADEEKSLVNSLEMLVYPAKEQGSELQERDEVECTAWAREQMDEMPASSPPAEPSGDDDSGQRRDRQRGGRGGLKGAAVGAVVGEALDDDEPEFSRGNLEQGEARDSVKDADSLDEARRDLKKAARDDDPSGAEVGAVVGAVAGRRRQTKAQQGAAEEKVAAEPAESTEADRMRSAIKVCLESRGYRVDY